MTNLSHSSVEAEPPRPESFAPSLPTEHHIVAAALMAERLRVLSEQLLLVLQHAPRDADMFTRVHGEALTAWCDMDDHYRAYQAILECKGQG
ncbi:hypothetical protein B5U98_29380 [Bosea sp. Tri-39]|nr:hypothetical protein BLM15_20015 [Bosea sp. Tri-49]RXT16121.1 hypothetical protein B5U98_29380 [Bosea sp. Tri-39]RXT39813.1 hypothetical protein B5U99_06425 [Bosea sp. Tri-54]